VIIMQDITKNIGKGSKQELLPNRHAMNTITRGEPWQRSINNYAKVTPSGEGAEGAPSVLQMAQVKY
jgi:hypothetical protein